MRFSKALLVLLVLSGLLATRASADTPPYPQPPATGGATVLTDTPAGGKPILSWSPSGGGGGGFTALTQDVTASGSGSVPATVTQAQDGAVVFTSAGLLCGDEQITPAPNGHGYTLGSIGPSGNYTGAWFGYASSGGSPATCTVPNNYNIVGDINGNTRVNEPSTTGTFFFDAQGNAIAQYFGQFSPYTFLFGSSTAVTNVGFNFGGGTPTWDGAKGALAVIDATIAPTCTPGAKSNGVLSSQLGALHWCNEAGLDFVISGNTGGTLTFQTYVNKGGSDSAGNGSPNAPWLTISHALATISGATAAQPYTVNVGPGTYAESVALVPWVFVSCTDPSTAACTLGSNITLASAFSAASPVAAFSSFTVNGSTTIDYTTVSQTAGEVILFDDILGGTFSETGFGSSNDDFVDFYGSFTSSTASVSGASIYSQGNAFGDLSSITAAALGASWLSIGDSFSPTLSINSGTSGVAVTLLSSTLAGTLSLTGTGIAYDATAGGIPPTISFSGGASASEITYDTAANGIGYTPTTPGNWASVPTTPQAGLDNLAALLPDLATPPTTGSAVVLTDTPAGGSAVLSWAAGGGGGTITLTGDTTGSGTSTIATTTGKVNGVSYPSGGALVTGNSCYVSGVSACAYGPLNLTAAGYVSGALPVANGGTSLSSAPSTGNSVLTDSAGTISWNTVPIDTIHTGVTTQGTSNTVVSSITIPANESFVCAVKWTGIVSTAGGTSGSVGDTIADTYTSAGANSAGTFGSSSTPTTLNNGTLSFTGTTFTQSFSGSNVTSTVSVAAASGGTGMVAKWSNEFSCVLAGP